MILGNFNALYPIILKLTLFGKISCDFSTLTLCIHSTRDKIECFNALISCLHIKVVSCIIILSNFIHEKYV